MHSITAASLLCFGCLVSAVPVAWQQNSGSSSSAPTSTSVAISSTGWQSTAVLPSTSSCTSAPPATTYTASSPSGSAFSYPLSNGFPNIENPSAQLTAIELQAHGTLPNGPPPPSLQADDETSLKLIAFNEISEVAFFTELLANLTTNATGYTFDDHSVRTQVIHAITAIQAQEELHALNANEALAHFGQAPVQPCQYAFPVSDFLSAIKLATTFTDVVLGTLQNVQFLAAQNGDAGLIPSVGSVIGQEGEQNGFFRSLDKNLIPSALPFLTTSTREFAFSALNQLFIVSGSCPNINTIPLPIFGALNVLTSPVAAATQNLTFSFTVTDGKTAPPASGASLVYINQQNVPVVETLNNVQTNGNVVTFNANFPYDQFEMNGLTIAAVTNSTGPFASAADVAAATLFGPGLIEIN